jgi:hypothetical protein
LNANLAPEGHSCCPVLLIECIFCINEQKAPILIALMGIPNMLHRVDAPFNTSCFEASTKLVNSTSSGLFGLSASQKEEASL